MPPKTRCPKGSRKNTKTGKCVSKNVSVNVTNSKCSTVKCSRDKICNPDSGKCVLRTGAIGKKLLEATGVIKKVDKKIERLRHDPRVSEDVKHHIEDLASTDPQVREHAEEILVEEIKTNPSLWEYLSEYTKQLTKLRPYLPYITTGLAVVGASAIYFTGTQQGWYNWMAGIHEIYERLKISKLKGKMIPAMTATAYGYGKVQRGVQNTWLKMRIPTATFQRMDQIMKLLDGSPANVGNLLTESAEKLSVLLCGEDRTRAFEYVQRIGLRLNSWIDTLAMAKPQGFKSQITTFQTWLNVFQGIGSNCSSV